MKKIKILEASGKTNVMCMKQAKRWFHMNPNRKVVNMKISPTYTITVTREILPNSQELITR